jgi:fibronectin type 3 domain-containing protein
MRRIIMSACAALAALVLGWSAVPAVADAAGPATPVALSATNGMSSIALTWRQPTTGTRPTSFRVYEGSTVVARNTTTTVTVQDLAFNSVHTYQVTAVDSAGRESAPSAPITRRVLVGGPIACGITAPTGLAVTEVTSSAVSLSWSNAIPYYDQPGTLVVLLDSVVVRQTTLDSARLGGLAPGSTHTAQVARRDCMGQLHPGAPVTFTTPSGPPGRPVAPGVAAVGARTATTIDLSWTVGGAPVTRYVVYEGATPVATTAGSEVRVSGLWRDTRHEFTVAAIDAAGGESPHTAPVQASTQPCPDSPGTVNASQALTATATASSSVALSWTQDFAATSYTVYRLAGGGVGAPTGPVATTRGTSALVSGLPSGSTTSYAVVAHTTCGSSAASAPVNVTTPSGPAARPAAPTGLTVTGNVPNYDFTGTVTLSWTQPTGADPAVGFRLYEGSAVLATSATTSVTLRLPGGPTHLVTVLAVDAAGNESAQSAPVTFTVRFIPPA